MIFPNRPLKCLGGLFEIYSKTILYICRQQKSQFMLKTISFFKITEGQQKGWYADVPNHTLEENQMVYGSDLFLEAVDKLNGGRNEVNITVSDNNESGEFIAKLIMKVHNQHGATYVLTGSLAERYGAVGFELWICNVTHDVLGEHPKSIYIHKIQ